MTVIVNICVLGLLSYMLFQTARQGLVDLQNGMLGTIFFSTFIIVYLVIIFRMIFHNTTTIKDHDHVKFFFPEVDQKCQRNQPDRIVKSVAWISTVCWGLMIITMAALHEASSSTEGDASTMDFITLLQSLSWNPAWTMVARITTLCMTIFSALGLYLRSRRFKRKTDRYPPGLIVIFLLSLSGMLYSIFYR